MSCEENLGVELLTDLCKWIAAEGKIRCNTAGASHCEDDRCV